MKLFLKIFTLLLVASLGYGFYIKSSETLLGDRIIGISVLVFSFVLMPLFIAFRWKKRRIEDYIMNPESIEKMSNSLSFKKEKINLILVARREPSLKTLAAELSAEYNINVSVIALDLSLPSSATEL